MSILFSSAEKLFTDENKDTIKILLQKQVQENRDWKEFRLKIELDDQDLLALSLDHIMEEKCVWENIAKLSKDLWIDYEHYRSFSFKGQYGTKIYKDRLANLGYVLKDGIWINESKPKEADVQLNIFVYCFYQLLVDKKGQFLLDNENNINEQIHLSRTEDGNNPIDGTYAPISHPLVGARSVSTRTVDSRCINKENIQATQNCLLCPFCDLENNVDNDVCGNCDAPLSDINIRNNTKNNMVQNIYRRQTETNIKEMSAKDGNINATKTYLSSSSRLHSAPDSIGPITQITWPCPDCTFVNRLDNDTCEVCFTNRNNLQEHQDEVMTGLYDDLSANRQQPKSNTIGEYKSEISNNTTEFKSLLNNDPQLALSRGGKIESTKYVAKYSHKATENISKKAPLNIQTKERNKDFIKDSLQYMPPMRQKQSCKEATKNYQSPSQKIEKTSDIVNNYSFNDTITSDTVTIGSNSAADSAKLSVPQHWSCTLCTYNNKLSNKCCEMCLTIPPMEPSRDVINDISDSGDVINDTSDSGDITNDTSDSGDITKGTSDSFYVTEVPSETWKCIRCNCDNLFDKYICGKCRDYAPFFRKWVCGLCSFFNKELSPQCAVCDSKNMNLIKCNKCKINNVNITVGRECDTCSTKVTVTSGATMDGWTEVRSRKCVACNNNVTATEGIFCRMCSKNTYYCNNRWCGHINSNKSEYCMKCRLKKGSNITDYNLVDVHIGYKYTKKWQCTFCGLLNATDTFCDHCKNIRRKGSFDKKCYKCNWINKSIANKCDKCFHILPKGSDK